MDVSITRDEGHAHVAAIRVLRYRLGRPPTMEEVAEVLGSRTEITNHRMRKLAALGIVHLVENPFNVHLSVADHLALERLPAEIDENALSGVVSIATKAPRHVFRWDLMATALGLNAVYLAAGLGLFLLAFESARQRGQLLQAGE